MSGWNQAEDIKYLRTQCPALAALSDAAVDGLYSWWSEEVHCAGWLMLTDGDGNYYPVDDFRKWLTAEVSP